MNIYKVQQGQSIYDICVQVYGSLDYLLKLMQDNGVNNIDIDFDSLVGKLFNYDPTISKRSPIFNNNDNKQIIYSTRSPFPSYELEGDFNDDFNEDFSI